jgi:glutamate racemase
MSKHVTGRPEHDIGVAVHALSRLVEMVEPVDHRGEFAVAVARELIEEYRPEVDE